jgi:hypothetical protein
MLVGNLSTVCVQSGITIGDFVSRKFLAVDVVYKVTSSTHSCTQAMHSLSTLPDHIITHTGAPESL